MFDLDDLEEAEEQQARTAEASAAAPAAAAAVEPLADAPALKASQPALVVAPAEVVAAPVLPKPATTDDGYPQAVPPPQAPAGVPPGAQPSGAPGRYKVVHTAEVKIRSEPSTSSGALGALEPNRIVEGTPYALDGTPWLRLCGEDARLLCSGSSAIAWVLINGKSVGLGELLQREPEDIVDGIAKWVSEQRKDSGHADQQHARELEALAARTRAQVDVLRPALETAAVVAELQHSGLLASEDASLGSAAVARSILKTLLLRRAGFGGTTKLNDVWSEAAFQSYVDKTVMPLAPFHCRFFDSKATSKRVLVLLHGRNVTGDDLASEAEVLRGMLLATTIVLPEAPVVLDSEHGLRAWWPPGPPVADIWEARKQGHMTAPTVAVQRIVATLRWVLRRFGELPVVLAGFSQGSQLLAQSLAALHEAQVTVNGLIVLSGLVESFPLPEGVRCLALHGGKDSVIPLQMAQQAAEAMKAKMAPGRFEFGEYAQLAHEVSDQELECMAKFCEECAPLPQNGEAQGTAEERAQEAKLLRYIKRMSVGLSVYDKDWYMQHFCALDMVGLGAGCPMLGGGLFRYQLHNTGPQSRGLVVFFHGKVSDLTAETKALVQAYVQALNVTVCVVDYRQRTSCLGLDAQLCLESLEELSGSSTKPVVVHGVGLGSTCAIHMAMAAQAMPAAVDRRIRLLVLDGGMGATHMNVGCTTKDPIANDSKLAYARKPLCLVGGDDPLFGLTVSDVQWNQLSELAEELLNDKKIPQLIQISTPALTTTDGRRCLVSGLYDVVNEALDRLPDKASAERGKDFIEDVLDVSEAFSQEKTEDDDIAPWLPQRGTSPKQQLDAICERALQEAGGLKEQLADVKALPDGPPRDERLAKLAWSALGPCLKDHGGFKSGVEGLRQFNMAMTSTSEFFSDLLELHAKVGEALGLAELLKVTKDRLGNLAGLSLEAAAAGGAKQEANAAGVALEVTHITKGGSITVHVKGPESTILEVRQAIMAKLGETNLNKVKLVIQEGKGTKMIPDKEPLGRRTELEMVGRALE